MSRFVTFAVTILLASCVWAIPEGWYIDSIQKHPEIRAWVRLFDESSIFRKENEDYDSVVYIGKFDKKIGEVYDELKVFSYFVSDFVPCFDVAKVKFISSEHRYFIKCSTKPDENNPDFSDTYFAVYRDIDDMGLIAVIQRGSYKELVRLGYDTDPSVKNKYNEPKTNQTTN